MHHDDHDLLPLQVDAVWDTQALGVINPRDRKQYARTVKALLADTFKYLLVTIEYEPFSHLGRPHSISYNAVKELYGAFSNVKFIAQVPAAAPLKPEWKENVFWMSSGEEDRLDSIMLIRSLSPSCFITESSIGRPGGPLVKASGTARNLISILSR